MMTGRKKQTLINTASCILEFFSKNPPEIVRIFLSACTISLMIAGAGKSMKDGVYSPVPLDYTLMSRIIFIVKK